MPTKLDLKKDLKHLYAPTAKDVSVVTVPAMHFIMIDGMGDPGHSQEFTDAIEALFPLAYTIKFASKKSGGPDYAVMPLEGLWWADDMADFVAGNRARWRWTLMIAQPAFVETQNFASAVEAVRKKKAPVSLDKVRFEAFEEGPSAQLMHIGPFATEHPNIMKIHDHIASLGKSIRGKHHEIYLSDFRKVAPGKMKTVLRQPFC